MNFSIGGACGFQKWHFPSTSIGVPVQSAILARWSCLLSQKIPRRIGTPSQIAVVALFGAALCVAELVYTGSLYAPLAMDGVSRPALQFPLGPSQTAAAALLVAVLCVVVPVSTGNVCVLVGVVGGYLRFL